MAKKIRKDFAAEVMIPAGIEVEIHGNTITMKKGAHELKKVIAEQVDMKKDGDKIILQTKKAKRLGKRNYGSAKSHIKNMIEGLDKGYEYELEICNVHFPITVTFDKAKHEFIIKNLLGEKSPRIVYAKKNIEVEVKAPKIKIKSYDVEAAGQTAADLEKVTKIRNRDRNKFQDGIFITKKPGVEFI